MMVKWGDGLTIDSLTLPLLRTAKIRANVDPGLEIYMDSASVSVAKRMGK